MELPESPSAETVDSLWREVLAIWSERDPFGPRPDDAFVLNEVSIEEQIRRLRLLLDWYRLYPLKAQPKTTQMNTPRAEEIRTELLEFVKDAGIL